MATAYQFKINGVDWSANVTLGSVHITNQIGQRSTATFDLFDATGALFLQGSHVEIYDETAVKVYGGFLEEDRIAKPGYSAMLMHSITCKDYHYLADKRLAAKSYLNQSAGSIVTDLFNTYLAAEGVVITATSIATGPTISEVIFTYEAVSKCIDAICQQSNYYWQIDQNYLLTFGPYGSSTAPFILDGTQVDQTKQLQFTEGNPQYVNRQFAVGSYGKTGSLTETRHGDGVTRAFPLSYEMSSENPTITVNGVAKTISTKGSTGYQWYIAEGDQTVAQDPSETVLTSGDTLVVTYKGRFPIVAMAQNAGLITSQAALEGIGTGYVESKYRNTKIKTTAGAFSVASSLLAHFGSRMRQLSFMTQKKGLAQGQLLTVNIPSFGLAYASMLIQSVEITDAVDADFGYWFIVSCVGSPSDVTWQSFFQNLVNQNDALDPVNVGGSSPVAVLTGWTAAWGWTTGTVTQTKNTCLICNTSTLCGAGQLVC